MSELTKKHHTDQIAKVLWHGCLYAVPVKVMEHYKVESDNKNYIPIDELFSDLKQTVGESAVLLKGLRYREGLTQVELAKKLNISQANLSAMENGRRTIGKELAKRIANIFNLDYRMLL
jgi:DNA-binding XRE family transcriptional regulator